MLRINLLQRLPSELIDKIIEFLPNDINCDYIWSIVDKIYDPSKIKTIFPDYDTYTEDEQNELHTHLRYYIFQYVLLIYKTFIANEYLTHKMVKKRKNCYAIYDKDAKYMKCFIKFNGKKICNLEQNYINNNDSISFDCHFGLEYLYKHSFNHKTRTNLFRKTNIDYFHCYETLKTIIKPEYRDARYKKYVNHEKIFYNIFTDDKQLTFIEKYLIRQIRVYYLNFLHFIKNNIKENYWKIKYLNYSTIDIAKYYIKQTKSHIKKLDNLKIKS